jgi:hypothetical protein
MATTTTEINCFPDELLLPPLGHALADALVLDFFLSAPEWQYSNFTPPLKTLVTIARLGAVCRLWRRLVYSILHMALSPAGSTMYVLIIALATLPLSLSFALFFSGSLISHGFFDQLACRRSVHLLEDQPAPAAGPAP